MEAMTKMNERVVAPVAKLKQLKLVHQRKDARAQTVETRREYLRRKILVGTVVSAKAEPGEIEEGALQQWVNPQISKPEDRVLFELDL
jgi:hypothetical protein